mgnify:CR=1 FL=1
MPFFTSQCGSNRRHTGLFQQEEPLSFFSSVSTNFTNPVIKAVVDATENAFSCGNHYVCAPIPNKKNEQQRLAAFAGVELGPDDSSKLLGRRVCCLSTQASEGSKLHSKEDERAKATLSTCKKIQKISMQCFVLLATCVPQLRFVGCVSLVSLLAVKMLNRGLCHYVVGSPRAAGFEMDQPAKNHQDAGSTTSILNTADPESGSATPARYASSYVAYAAAYQEGGSPSPLEFEESKGEVFGWTHQLSARGEHSETASSRSRSASSDSMPSLENALQIAPFGFAPHFDEDSSSEASSVASASDSAYDSHTPSPLTGKRIQRLNTRELETGEGDPVDSPQWSSNTSHTQVRQSDEGSESTGNATGNTMDSNGISLRTVPSGEHKDDWEEVLYTTVQPFTLSQDVPSPRERIKANQVTGTHLEYGRPRSDSMGSSGYLINAKEADDRGDDAPPSDDEFDLLDMPVCESFSQKNYAERNSKREISISRESNYLKVHVVYLHYLQGISDDGLQLTGHVLKRERVARIPASLLNPVLVNALTVPRLTEKQLHVRKYAENQFSAAVAGDLSASLWSRNSSIVNLCGDFVQSSSDLSDDESVQNSPGSISSISRDINSQVRMIAQKIILAAGDTFRIHVTSGQIKFASSAQWSNGCGLPVKAEHSPLYVEATSALRKLRTGRMLSNAIKRWDINQIPPDSAMYALARDVTNRVGLTDCDQVWKETKYLYSLCLLTHQYISRYPNVLRAQSGGEGSCESVNQLLEASARFLAISLNEEYQKKYHLSLLNDPVWIQKISPGMVFVFAQRTGENSPRDLYQTIIFGQMRDEINSGNSQAVELAHTLTKIPLSDYAKGIFNMLTAEADLEAISPHNWFDILSHLRKPTQTASSSLGKQKIAVAFKKVAAKFFGRGDLAAVSGNLTYHVSDIQITQSGKPWTMSHVRFPNPDARSHGGQEIFSAPEFTGMLRQAELQGEKILYCDHLDPNCSDEAPRSALIQDVAKNYRHFFALQQVLDGWFKTNQLTRLSIPEDDTRSDDTVLMQFMRICTDEISLTDEFNAVGALRSRMLAFTQRASLKVLQASISELDELCNSYIEFDKNNKKSKNKKKKNRKSSDDPLQQVRADLNELSRQLSGSLDSLKISHPFSELNGDFPMISVEDMHNIKPVLALFQRYIKQIQNLAIAFPLELQQHVQNDALWSQLEGIIQLVLPSNASDSGEFVKQTALSQIALGYALFELLAIAKLQISQMNNTCKDGIDRGAAMLLIVEYLSAILSEGEEFKNPNHLQHLIELFMAPAYMAKSQAVLPERLALAENTVKALTELAMDDDKRKELKQRFAALSGDMQIQKIEIPTVLPDRDFWPHLDISLGDIMRMDRQLQRQEELKDVRSSHLFTNYLEFLSKDPKSKNPKSHNADLGSQFFDINNAPYDFSEEGVQKYCNSLAGFAPISHWLVREFGLVAPDQFATSEGISSQVECVVQTDGSEMLVKRELDIPLLTPYLRRTGEFSQMEQILTENDKDTPLTFKTTHLPQEQRNEYRLHVTVSQRFFVLLHKENQFAGSDQMRATWYIHKIHASKDDL